MNDVSDYQLALLASIQRLALSGARQTGMAIRHEVTCWENGDYWSHLSAHDDDSNRLFTSHVRLRRGDDTVPEYEQQDENRHTLAEQYAALTYFVANNRMEAIA